MSQDRDTCRRPATEDGSGDGSLNEALDDLQSIIERRKPDSSSATDAGEDRALGPSGATAQAANASPAEIHAAVPEAPPGTLERELADLDAGACDRIAERLANEVEIIMNARLEWAVREALADARREVRKHIAIVLPELLGEILNDNGRR